MLGIQQKPGTPSEIFLSDTENNTAIFEGFQKQDCQQPLNKNRDTYCIQ